MHAGWRPLRAKAVAARDGCAGAPGTVRICSQRPHLTREPAAKRPTSKRALQAGQEFLIVDRASDDAGSENCDEHYLSDPILIEV